MKLKTRRWLALLSTFAFISLTGVRGAVTPEPKPIDLVVHFGLSWSIAVLCLFDSRHVGKPVAHAFLWSCVIFWPFLAPPYLVWSRGLRGIGIALIFVFLAFVVLSVSFFTTGYALYGMEWLLSAE